MAFRPAVVSVDDLSPGPQACAACHRLISHRLLQAALGCLAAACARSSRPGQQFSLGTCSRELAGIDEHDRAVAESAYPQLLITEYYPRPE